MLPTKVVAFMNNDVHGRVLNLLMEDFPPSRNRNFDRFKDPDGQRVYRLYRIYLSLLAELEEAAERPEVQVRFSREGDGYRLIIENPKVAYRRNCLVPISLAAPFLERLKALGLEVS
jgi:hypothetical protein